MCYAKYVVMQRQVKYTPLANILGTLAAVLVAYITIIKLDMKMKGAGIAGSVCFLVRFLVVRILTYLDSNYKPYLTTIFSKETTEHLQH